MITVQTNLSEVSGRLVAKFKNIGAQVKDKLVRSVATTMLSEVHNRVHVEGKKADDSQIGTYSNTYLKRRQKN